MIKQIPNIFTLLNLILGCMAIVFILQTENLEIHQEYIDTITVTNLPESIQWGCICIFLAAIVDFLDGFVARLLKATSPMGAQLDSLSDVVSFGVAPALIMWQLLRVALINNKEAINYLQAWLWPALLIAACGAWRLARFNISTTQSSSFLGLPIPAAGMLIATLPMAIFYNTFNLNSIVLNPWFLYGVIALVSWLMVSNLRLMAMKFSNFSVKKYMHIVILLAVSVISIVALRWYAGIVILLTYVALSIIYKNKLES